MGSCSDRASEKTQDSFVTEVAIAHVHLSLFGFEFSPPPSNEPDERDDDFDSLAFFRVENDAAILSFGYLPDAQLLLHGLSMPRKQLSDAAILNKPRPCPQTPFVRLCDSARFERSGVLLI